MQGLKSRDRSVTIGDYLWYHCGFICMNCILSMIPLHLIQYILASLCIAYSAVLCIISLSLHHSYSPIRASCMAVAASQFTLVSCCSTSTCPCSISMCPYIYFVAAGAYQGIPTLSRAASYCILAIHCIFICCISATTFLIPLCCIKPRCICGAIVVTRFHHLLIPVLPRVATSAWALTVFFKFFKYFFFL